MTASKPTPKSEPREDRLRLAADKFVAAPKVWACMQKATADADAFARAQKDPEAFFAAQGAKVPKGLMLEAFVHPPRQLPGPDWTPFFIELSACRSWWVRVCDDSEPPKCEFRQESVCFGFRIRPRFLPWGPVPPLRQFATPPTD